MAKKYTVEGEVRLKDGVSGPAAQAKSGISGLASSMSVGLVAGVTAGILALKSLVTSVVSWINEAAEAETAVTKLNQALIGLGPSANSVSLALQAQAKELQKTTTFGDDIVIQAQAAIAAFVKEETAIKAITAAAADYAAATGTDIVSAAQLLTKTFASSTNALQRYGIEVEGAAGSSERLASMVGNLNAAFGGQAAAEVDTYAGKIKQMQNAWGDLKEEVGKVFVENGSLSTSLKELTALMASDTGQALARGFGETLLFVGKAVAALGAAIAAIVGTISLALSGILQLAKGFSYLGSILPGARNDMMLFRAEIQRWQDSMHGATATSFETANALTKVAFASQTVVQEAITAAEAARSVAAAQAQQTAAAEKLAAANAAANEATKSLTESTGALGIVTSQVLAIQLGEMMVQLEAQRLAMGENSKEFQAYEKQATTAMNTIVERVKSLQLGLGDITAKHNEVAESSTRMVESFEAESAAMDGVTKSIDSQVVAYEQLAAVKKNSASPEGSSRDSGSGGFSSGSSKSSFGGNAFASGSQYQVVTSRPKTRVSVTTKAKDGTMYTYFVTQYGPPTTTVTRIR